MRSRSESTSAAGSPPPIDLEEASRLASLQFSIGEVAVILGIDEAAFAAHDGLARAYMRGRLLAQAEVRTAMLQAAKQGSTPAQKQFQELADKSEPQVEP